MTTVDVLVSDQVLDRCETALGYRFKDRSLLRSALTHASGANHRLESNERLEFLGDAILSVIVCEQLYKQFPEYAEGELTKVKSTVVSGHSCAQVSHAMGVDAFLFLGKSMASRASLPESLSAAVFAACIRFKAASDEGLSEDLCDPTTTIGIGEFCIIKDFSNSHSKTC